MVSHCILHFILSTGLNCLWNIAAEDNQYVNIVFREPFEVQCDEQCSLDYIRITKGLVTPESQGKYKWEKTEETTDRTV